MATKTGIDLPRYCKTFFPEMVTARPQLLEVAEKICDKIAMIKDGKLIVSGSMDEVKGDSSLEDLFLELEGNEDFNIGDSNA